MSFDQRMKQLVLYVFSLNPFRAGRCLSTCNTRQERCTIASQSLSSRAMSFDSWNNANILTPDYVSIPFEQGDVFRRQKDREVQVFENQSQSLSSRAMSFDTNTISSLFATVCLNPFPFRAGRCLSTLIPLFVLLLLVCLNPFRAGRCLSTTC